MSQAIFAKPFIQADGTGHWLHDDPIPRATGTVVRHGAAYHLIPVRVDGEPMSCIVTVGDFMRQFEVRAALTPKVAMALFESHLDTIRRVAEVVILGRSATRRGEELDIGL